MTYFGKKVFFLSVLFLILMSMVFESFSLLDSSRILYKINSDWIETEFNGYFPDGNSSVLLAIDTNLMGEDKVFANESMAKNLFKFWLTPFEKRFNIAFNLGNITLFDPQEDSLDTSIEKVAENLNWNFANGIEDPRVNGNGHDWLLIYQENWAGGQNRVNAIFGNTLIVSHIQPFDWTTNQLILLHELGHLYGGEHNLDGNVSQDWYVTTEYSIMDYGDLTILSQEGWNKDFLPIDDHNFETMNNSKYRFDRNDADLDGLPNYYEYRYGFNPTIDDSLEDTDDDGLNNLREFQYGTDPSAKDTDEDGYSDWAETYFETSPLDSSEFPEVNVPIILPWTNITEISEKETIKLKWRAVSSNPQSFIIYQNDTEVLQDSWLNEVIQYEPDQLKPGTWNFTCLVSDTDGDQVAAEIWLQVKKVEKTSIFMNEIFLGFLCLIILYQKKKKNR
ncbi:MAG: hypothetical protein ACFFAJ_14485 [Candidatus Hodarchaeota archaeon]